ncbi:MAG: 2,3-bisphosphoglycerate-independent phosphoglycerate mutase [Clostridiaceae bacterium]|nr:2,3-bisphosphoglycerate-independent phosphoglycerate mutase [Clostridiaceae bacterium]
MKKPVMLMVLDGWGKAPVTPDNAVTMAETPRLDALFARYPSALLRCSGRAVGLPDGQMGNSEVGHTNLGAGRVVYQELTRITKSIEDGDFFTNPVLLGAVDHAKMSGGRVHLMGLLSDGGVHSHIDHLFALLRLCSDRQVPASIHCFMDGRDTPPDSGVGYIRKLQAEIKMLGGDLSIDTVMGRYYAMDRDQRWDRVQRAYDAVALGREPFCEDPAAAMEESYANGVTDEFVEPVRCREGSIVHRDSVIFYNFRPDRARELTRALCDPAFDGFAREPILPYFICMTQYDAEMPNVEVAFRPEKLEHIFGQVISEHGLTQLRIAETEKYAHVTFFFNGGEERVFPGEDRALIPSPRVATYDLQPEMSADAVADECVRRIESGKYDVIVLNFANCDMVGHTGVFEAAVQAVEAVDRCAGRVLAAMEKAGGVAIVTADHGNAEKMRDEQGQPFTAHTTGDVPVILCKEGVHLRDGALCDVAPTLLELLGIEKPAEMTGESLILH